MGDFLLRFVYYETLVTVLKTLGVKNGIISFDDLKKEYVKKRLYGYLESSRLLCASGKPSSVKRRTVSITPQTTNGKVVNSRILGTFVPKAKVVAVGAEENENLGDKITEM